MNNKNLTTEIAGSDFVLPFSRVILANSLETIGIDFYKAHERAQKIDNGFNKQGLKRITRGELRDRVFEHLKKDINEETALKYLKFRKIMALKKPLIILLGGSTGSGKDTVSMELAHRLDIMTVITTDIIREIMRSLFSDEILPMIHTSSYLAYKKLWIPLEKGKNYQTVAYREQSLRVNAGIRSIIKRSIKENTTLIINGVHILPDIIKYDEFKDANLIKIFIYVKNKSAHKERFYIRGMSSEGRDAAKYIDNFNTIREIQKYIINRSKKLQYLCINNCDSKETALIIINHIINEVSKRESI